MPNRQESKGFTLIELLVVISIIALLMAILLPSLGRAKELALGISCRSRLKQNAIGFAMHADDNNGEFPGIEGLSGKYLFSSKKNVNLSQCPTATKTYEQGGKPPFMAPRKGRSYLYNPYVSATGKCNNTEEYQYWRNQWHKKAERIPLLLDGYGESDDRGPKRYDHAPAFESEIFTWSQHNEALKGYCQNRHSGGIYGLFCDSSLRWVSLKELWDLPWSKDWFEQEINGPGYPPLDWPPWMQKLPGPHK